MSPSPVFPAMNNQMLRNLAHHGARVRYRELMAELTAIARAFPDAIDGSLVDGALVRAAAQAEDGSAEPASKQRSRRTMTAKQRAAVSRRMRAYWKKRRGEKTARA